METKGTLRVTSSTVRDGETAPNSMVFNGMGVSGENRSPDLQWSGAPAGTKSFAVTCWDPDAPTSVGFTHWVLFDIPPTVTSLEAGSGAKSGGTHGRNDMGNTSYDGPAPPPGHGPHRYHFTVYALDVDKLGANEGASYPLIRFLIRDHVLAQGELTAIYER